MSTLSPTQTEALIHMRGAGGLVTNGKGFARPTMSALRAMGLVTYTVYEHEFLNELTGRVNRPYAWVAYLTPEGAKVADSARRGRGVSAGRKPVWLMRRTFLGDVPFGRLAVGDTIAGKVVAVTETPTDTTIVIKESV